MFEQGRRLIPGSESTALTILLAHASSLCRMVFDLYVSDMLSFHLNAQMIEEEV